MKRYRVRRVPIRPLLRFGLVLGGGVALPFGCLFALVIAKAISLLRHFLEGWQRAEYRLLGQTVHFDFVQILSLDGVLQTLQTLDQRLGLVAVLALLSITLGAGLVGALLAGLAGGGYNLIAGLSGGIELQLAETEPSPAVPGLRAEARGEAGRVPGARAWLVPAQPDAAEPSCPLRGEVTSIGSGTGNAIVLPFPGIAERHAEIRREGDRYVLYDLGSAHGSYVNGRRTRVNLLKDGWTVSFGDKRFVFRESAIKGL
jgi:hypothetical protein